MKKIYQLLFVCLAFSFTVTTSAQNPYESLGIETKVLTLSNGKYQEFFPNDTLQPIGNVMVNTITGEIHGFLEIDTMYAEWSLEPEVMSRFLSIDPLATKFPEWSPYSYTFNNPIRFIDPDGRAPEDVIIIINATDKNNFGHAGVAVDEYDNDGNLTGNVIVYHLAPGGEEPGKGSVLNGTGVEASYTREIVAKDKFLEDSKANYDGVLEVSTTAEQDQAAITALDQTISDEVEYNPVSNNCATFSCSALEPAMNTENIGNETASKMFITRTFKTPNALFNDLKKQDNVNVIKDASKFTKTKFIEYINNKY